MLVVAVLVLVVMVVLVAVVVVMVTGCGGQKSAALLQVLMAECVVGASEEGRCVVCAVSLCAVALTDRTPTP